MYTELHWNTLDSAPDCIQDGQYADSTECRTVTGMYLDKIPGVLDCTPDVSRCVQLCSRCVLMYTLEYKPDVQLCSNCVPNMFSCVQMCLVYTIASDVYWTAHCVVYTGLYNIL